MGSSEADVKTMDTMKAESTNKKGAKSTSEGVLIGNLLKLAGPLKTLRRASHFSYLEKITSLD